MFIENNDDCCVGMRVCVVLHVIILIKHNTTPTSFYSVLVYTVHISVAPIQKFTDIPIHRYFFQNTADTDADTDNF